MIVPKLLAIFSPDIENLEEFSPESPEDFSLFIQLRFGFDDQCGEDVLHLLICTPRWLMKNIEKFKVISGHGLVISNNYSYDKIKKNLSRKIHLCKSTKIDEVYMKLRGIGLLADEDDIDDEFGRLSRL